MTRAPNRKARRKTSATRRKNLSAPAPGGSSIRTTARAEDREGIIFGALPDNYQIRVTLNAHGMPKMLLPGRIVLFDDMQDMLDKVGRELWFPKAPAEELTDAKWVINMLADADRYTQALRFLEAQLADFDIPIFNHPTAVLGTRRDYVWQKLSGISQLTAPKCILLQPKHPNDFLQAFEKEGFEYPVMIRPAGTHTGKELALVRDRKEWNKLFEMAWGGRDIYITQWVDFRSEEGEWRKIRLSITNDKISVRHILFADNWLIHSVERGAEEAERELGILANANEWDSLQKLGEEIRKRIGLDFFGVDLGWKSDTEFVLFEANASMSILTYSKMPLHRREEFERVVAEIESDVWKAIKEKTGMM